MSKKLKRWLIGIGVVTAVVVLITLLFNIWMNSDSTGTVKVGGPKQDSNIAQAPLTLSNQYFTTLLPTELTVRRQATSANPDSLYTALVTALVGTTGEKDEQFAVAIAQLPSTGLPGVGDYNLRTSQTASYQPYTLPNLPNGAQAFRTASGAAAVTVFWPHGTIYVELAFSSGGGATLSQLQQVYEQILNAWNWN